MTKIQKQPLTCIWRTHRIFALPTNVELNTLSSEEEVTKARVDYESLHTENSWSKDYEDVTAGYSKEPVTEAPDEPSIFMGRNESSSVFVFC